jgi:hypothetical protein
VGAKSYSSAIYAFVKEANMKIDDKLLQQASAQRIVACNWILQNAILSPKKQGQGFSSIWEIATSKVCL